MPLLETITRLRTKIFNPSGPLIPILLLKGVITPQMTYSVHKKLQMLPKRAKKLAVVINSPGGDLSQALIISEILKSKTKERNIQLVTFAEQFVLNSAFMILLQGNRVFADNTTYVGGAEIGESKFVFGEMNKYIERISYSNDNSYVQSRLSSYPYQQNKKEQLQQLYSHFASQFKQQIFQARKNHIVNPNMLDLTKIYMGSEAKQLGLIDQTGRVYSTLPKLIDNPHLGYLSGSEIRNFISSFKRIQFSL